MKLLREKDPPDFYEKLFFFSRIKLECQDMYLKHFKNLLFEMFPHLQKPESFVTERDLKITIYRPQNFQFHFERENYYYYYFGEHHSWSLKFVPFSNYVLKVSKVAIESLKLYKIIQFDPLSSFPNLVPRVSKVC